MSDVRSKILLILLLFVSLTTAAEDAVIQRGCRVGTPRPQGMALRRAQGAPKQVGGDFYHGERHQLTVLVEFNDRAFKGDEAATLEQWNKIFNVENFTEAPFKGSVHDYFLAQSYGDFIVFFDLFYVKVSGDVTRYESTYSDDENSQYLVQDIMEVLKTRNDIDWSLYDWNGDGFVNQLLIIYAGQGMNDYDKDQYPKRDLIWPHQWWMSEHLKDGKQGEYCDPIPVTYGGKQYKVDCYCALAELTSKNDYGSFGTICHEYTHCFGFPDFYYGPTGTKYVYYWDLMDSGNYNGSGYRPPGYSAHERWFMGWLTPIVLKENKTIENMPSLADKGAAYLIRNDGFDNEYYIIENRQQTSWDTSLPGSGILIFHIDYDAELWISTTEYVNTAARQHYVLFQANNSSTYAQWAYPYLANDSLTNSSNPKATLNNENTDGTKLMNKSVRDIAVTDGLASFRFTIDQSTGIVEHRTSQPYTVLHDLGPIYIIRYANGDVKKVMKHR